MIDKQNFLGNPPPTFRRPLVVPTDPKMEVLGPPVARLSNGQVGADSSALLDAVMPYAHRLYTSCVVYV